MVNKVKKCSYPKKLPNGTEPKTTCSACQFVEIDFEWEQRQPKKISMKHTAIHHLVMYSLKKFIPVIRKAEQCSENIVEDIYQAGKRCMIIWEKHTLLKLICVTEEKCLKTKKSSTRIWPTAAKLLAKDITSNLS